MKNMTIIVLLLFMQVLGCSSNHYILNYEPDDDKLSPLLILGDTTSLPNTVNGGSVIRDTINYDVEPVPIYHIAPTYPPSELISGNEADVFVKALVTTEGKVKQVIVYKSSSMQFNRAAAEAAIQWKFKPGTLKGNPVFVWVHIPFRFRLNR